ncbi:Cilia- and flagella-associated protein 20 [Orchesella cincta]|uniref:Cilia-and flagella-associated protein 20 n=1 Tax=Orchesella cincta TaxID=48709 RepID=A0A1D2NFR9_ORCCI|nr:Cilia- and flagella-associated protein 20 [Orchesella cincta]
MANDECGVREKYAQKFKAGEDPYFQLYTTYSKPGLVSIFYNEDQRSFHNWGLEVGSGRKRGRIREAIDHQINTPVLEIAGNHDGSVYMVCPPDQNKCINVTMPYVTMLMKDMHGYSSVEFTALDSLGFSRKICAKNFKSRCVIGELNCEIPMRLSPTWNYASVNLDETLRNAFGTKLVSVQRIKINANVRVRRVYFSEEIFGYKRLPQEFRIKLALTPQEKHEIQMYEEFLTNEPKLEPERSTPWSLPKLVLAKPDMQLPSYRPLRDQPKKKVEVIELPEEVDADKYTNARGPKVQSNSSNTGRLLEMLTKSIPPSKILLPTLSLIYPDKRSQAEADAIQAEKVAEYLRSRGGQKETRFFRKSKHGGLGECEPDESSGQISGHEINRLKKCIELEHHHQTDGAVITDWEKMQGQGQHHCKYTTMDLARYLKKREALGDYDLFRAAVKNPRFLDSQEEAAVEEETFEEEKDSSDDESEPFEYDNQPAPQVDSNPWVVHRVSQTRASKAKLSFARRSTISKFTLQDPSRIGSGWEEEGVNEADSTESWIWTWAYNGASWSQTREINQKLLQDARLYYATNHNQRKSIVESRLPQHYQVRRHQPPKMPEEYRFAIPILPRTMKEDLRGTGGYFDLVFDNSTLPIERY